MTFPNVSDEEFQKATMSILESGSKNNTYKFAFMRFLLDYCSENTETHVEFSTIAQYYFKYYWIQECKSKLKQSLDVGKQPRIIKIIRKEFDELEYPQTFEKISKVESEKIHRCTVRITKLVFRNVSWGFQKQKVGDGMKEKKVFFDYKMKNSGKRYVDLDAGIDINPKAMKFFKKHNTVLKKAVNLEWARFLEKLNLGVPNLIRKMEK